MSAGPKYVPYTCYMLGACGTRNNNENRYEYHWADGTTVKKAIKVSAPEYVDYLMTWVQNQLDDETIFPSKIGIYLHQSTHSHCV